MSDHDKPTLDLALTVARWDDTKDPATNAIPHWAVNLAMALIESDWLSEHDRQVAERAWDACVEHVEAVLGGDMKRAAYADNPHRAAKGEQ